MKIFLVGGRAGEGKTTFAVEAIEALRVKDLFAEKVSFAQGVKDTASFMGWDGDKDDRGRRLLQVIGGAGREYDLDIWANRAVRTILQMTPLPHFVFIDDWRFPNEEVVLRREFADVSTIRIVRRPVESHLLWGTPMYNDPSESSLDDYYNDQDYDYLVVNDGSLTSFVQMAERFAKELIRVEA